MSSMYTVLIWQTVLEKMDLHVDISALALGGDQYWDAWRVAEDMIGDRVVDLVEIETAKQSLRRAIEQHGIDL